MRDVLHSTQCSRKRAYWNALHLLTSFIPVAIYLHNRNTMWFGPSMARSISHRLFMQLLHFQALCSSLIIRAFLTHRPQCFNDGQKIFPVPPPTLTRQESFSVMSHCPADYLLSLVSDVFLKKQSYLLTGMHQQSGLNKHVS
jgi:hypothetical protein